jgi:hypothetical protein
MLESYAAKDEGHFQNKTLIYFAASSCNRASSASFTLTPAAVHIVPAKSKCFPKWPGFFKQTDDPYLALHVLVSTSTSGRFTGVLDSGFAGFYIFNVAEINCGTARRNYFS